MEKKYQLVAWTRNVADKENARLTMIPSLAYEIEEPFIEEISRCIQEQKNQKGRISISLAKRYSREDILQEGSCKTMLEFHSSAAIYHSSGNCCSSSEFNI